jgi:hypothetical protein
MLHVFVDCTVPSSESSSRRSWRTPLFFPLPDALQGGLTVAKAEVVVTPRNKREWLKLQLLNINLTNLTLIFAVLALSVSINHTLEAQKVENRNAAESLASLRSALQAAQPAVEWLKTNRDLIDRFQNVSYYAEQLKTAQDRIEQLSNTTEAFMSSFGPLEQFPFPSSMVNSDAGPCGITPHTPWSAAFIERQGVVTYSFILFGLAEDTCTAGNFQISLPRPCSASIMYQFGLVSNIMIKGGQFPNIAAPVWICPAGSSRANLISDYSSVPMAPGNFQMEGTITYMT